MSCLAYKLYDPAVAVTKSTATAIAMTALDTTNLHNTFTVPPSGRFLVRMQGAVHGATTAPQIMLGVAPADWRADDQSFDPEARLEALADDLEDLERFIGEVEAAGDEFVDPWESSIDHDSDFRMTRRGRR